METKRQKINSDELYKLIGQIEVEGHNNLNRGNLNRLETGMALGEQNGMDYKQLHLWLQGIHEMLSYEVSGSKNILQWID